MSLPSSALGAYTLLNPIESAVFRGRDDLLPINFSCREPVSIDRAGAGPGFLILAAHTLNAATPGTSSGAALRRSLFKQPL
jgi:hypothetical protein